MWFRFLMIAAVFLVVFLAFYLTIWKNVIKPWMYKDTGCCGGKSGCCKEKGDENKTEQK